MKTEATILLFRGRGIAGTLIRWQSRGPWSHAAIELGGQAWEAREFRRVQKRNVGEIVSECLRSATRLAALRITLTDAQAAEMTAWLDSQIGKRYDWSSVFRFVTRRQASRKAAEVWFCSELVFAAFRHIGIDLLARTEPWEVSPALLARTPLAAELETLVRVTRRKRK